MTKLLVHLFTTLLLLSCGKFNLSPYISKTNKLNLNHVQLERIAQRESLFGSSFKVAVISDTHDFYSDLKKIIKHINQNAHEYAFVLVNGDLTNIGLLSEFETAKKFLDKLTIPYVTTIGNHDLLTNGGVIFKQMFGADSFVIDFKQTRFVIYNNNNWESPNDIPNFPWVEKQLDESTATHNILAAHVAVNDRDRFVAKDMDLIKNLVNSFSVSSSRERLIIFLHFKTLCLATITSLCSEKSTL